MNIKSIILTPIILWAVANYAVAAVAVTDAWVRNNPSAVHAGYMTITSDRDTVLISAASAGVDSIEIHAMSLRAGVMHMQRIAKLALPKNTAVQFKPGGYHLMIFGNLQQADTLPITLKFGNGEQITVQYAIHKQHN